MKNVIIKYALLSALIVMCCGVVAAENRWDIENERTIKWTNDGRAHSDHIEMAGKEVACVLRYGIAADSSFVLNTSMIWPLLRTLPDNTNASLMRRFDWNPIDLINVNGRSISDDKVTDIRLHGMMEVNSNFTFHRGGKGALKRIYFPSADRPALVEAYTVYNTGEKPMTVEIPETRIVTRTDSAKGRYGSYSLVATIDKAGSFAVAPGDSLQFTATISGYKAGEPEMMVDVADEMAKRSAMLDMLADNLVLETPDEVINTMFGFSKIRACESIFDTDGGPMHGPGGEAYYAAIWANDQAEYVNPFFPFTGYDYGNESAINSYMHFARFMNDEWKPIPSSIIAEGRDIWNGAGDRGDAAMIAYGAARFALARGNREEALKLWPLIEWCLEYCRRNLNADGVVASDSDELEGRFPSGDANLCTSSLYYDALISASYLARDLGISPSASKKYMQEARRLRTNIEKYFGANVEGYDTYAYYKGNDILRAWICIPLTVGIDDRAQGTIDALFSPRLWTENGLLTQAGSETFWDRSTLYALRGVFAAGATNKATDYLKRYSTTRLLGEHVPYAIEAWPEGSQRHLSAESGLYARIITEGLFGIRPTGLRSFTLTPRLPEGWDFMRLRDIRAFGSDFSIEVTRKDADRNRVTVTENGRIVLDKTIPVGKTVDVKLTVVNQ